MTTPHNPSTESKVWKESFVEIGNAFRDPTPKHQGANPSA